MQYGRFFDNGCDQHIGSVGFVFKSESGLNHFERFPRIQPNGDDFKEVNGPDFVDRFRGMVDRNDSNYESLENMMK